KPLYNVAYRYVWNGQQAQDVVHDAFLELWARRATVVTATADRYVWTSVLNYARKRRRWNQLRSFLHADDDEAAKEVSAQSAECEVMHAETGTTLQQAIDALPPKLREVLLLTAFSEMSYDAIAEMLAIPPGTVASRRHLALQRLRQELQSR
ncbi:MAG TPA: sigma-70 family RNA polymerase sigma factor, partial [Povalibacter sp.]